MSLGQRQVWVKEGLSDILRSLVSGESRGGLELGKKGDKFRLVR